MKTQESKTHKNGKHVKKSEPVKHSQADKTDKNHLNPYIYNEYDEVEILQEFFTHPNFLEDYLA